MWNQTKHLERDISDINDEIFKIKEKMGLNLAHHHHGD